MTIALFGVPTNSSGTTDGVARAPSVLRAAGLLASVQQDAEVIDLGDISVDPPSSARGPDGIIDAAGLAAALARVRDAVGRARRNGHRVLLVGGDCPIVIGALAGCADVDDRGEPLGLLFVDGHEDAWPPTASTTGEAADMELGLLIGRSLDGLDPALAAQLPRLAVDRVRVLGARDRDELADAGIDSIGSVVTVVDDAAIRSDPAGVASDGVRAIGGPARSWWLHVDLDVLSTDALAAVDYQQAGGLDWVHLETLADSALAVGGCVGVTVTVYNPDLDPDRGGAARIVAWLAHLVTALDPP